MVVRSPITTIMRRVIHEMKEIVIELFKEDELLVNITKHVLVPLHQILSNDEKQLLLDRYKLKEHQLPRIQCDDPVARFYGAVPGQVIKITRRSESAGRYIIYRLVI
jgi:DNA-directed RNA polymerase I, II, and III subunit RPABC1